MKTKYCKASGTGGRNQPKSLSGIETYRAIAVPLRLPIAGINLNPYQGLKLMVRFGMSKTAISRNQPKSLSGIETYLSVRQ